MLTVPSASCEAQPVLLVRHSDLVGTWQGYAEDKRAFVRLELNRSGQGAMAISYWPDTNGKRDTVRCYQLQWHQILQGGQSLDITLRPVSRTSEFVTVLWGKGYCSYPWGSAITLRLRQGLWEEDVVLFSESRYEGRARSERDVLRKLR